MHEIDFDRTRLGSETETFEYPASGSVFNENEVMELASEALELNSEADLENFLGDLISKAGGAIGKLIKSPVGQALGGVLKSAAKQLLPMAGQAVGGLFGSPAIGGQLASAAGSALGLNEAEAEERDFEAAQTLVRLAGDAVKNAAAAPHGANPQAVANAAFAQAAQVHAPGLAPPSPRPGAPSVGEGGHGRSGRWIRRGGKIILLGA